ncbi:alpha/beta-hydrolase [Penicillium cataractarum]|uniref:Alpha/beta-hydrolase n=1 Tax=Penicillium cataractarum TaxID=2100454 RepID=A0A9W9RYA6_9EURO|nr:alpha/beta-hydrolase [Penicillium cataractarum]KAJ5367890.1 alpha/beta-hydrolase [Penicillium cataractarum]
MALPTIVFVPGAWHTCDYYKQVISILMAKGFPTVTVNLPSVGGISSMADDALAIQEVTSKLVYDGQEIILVMHSYGGIPGTESAKGLSRELRLAKGEPGGIIALVYVTAYLIKEGMSVETWAMKMEPQSAASFSGALTYAAHRDIPAIYLLCEEDMSLPIGLQELFVSYAEGKITTRICKAGHSPMVTMPDDVVDTILMAVEA